MRGRGLSPLASAYGVRVVLALPSEPVETEEREQSVPCEPPPLLLDGCRIQQCLLNHRLCAKP
ncbi:MAG UNVERIFIED_CONTAM: hypothetical protein LVR18_11710 [Planctomycetaceae bacterium]